MEREETIFQNAVGIDSTAAREAYLREACAGDKALLQSVQSLLEVHERARRFLDPQPPADAPVPSLATLLGSGPVALTEKPGERIGRYKLLEKIGEGGCGVVYMAEQEEPVRRRVALKVIKIGMDTEAVVARFEAERQALALMDHPNIAKVLDAGATETGRPFFVMELVRGTKITEFCDHNSLTTPQRLDLFMQVCRAVQHAHQKGIIHRDIKPSNILVTLHDGVAVPKVIDFGIAKATQGRLTDKTVFTAFHQFIGTPAYMSPEQAEMSGLDTDTRSDIYSLGVLLYELLTGKTPFDTKQLLEVGLDAMRRMIREEEPARPSTKLSTMVKSELTTTANRRQTEPPKLIHAVRGDLDWIVMKCLEKDRGRRYETANGLAMDIERHLENEPVVARPPSNVYRLQKTMRRHQGAFAAAAVILLLLVAGAGVSTWEAVRARRAEQEQKKLRRWAEASEAKARINEKKARTEAVTSQQVVRFLQRIVRGFEPGQSIGPQAAWLKELFAKASTRITEELTNQPEVEISLRAALVASYEDLAMYQEEEASAARMLELTRTRMTGTNAMVGLALYDVALALDSRGKLHEAEAAARQSVAIWRKLLAEQAADPAPRLGETVDEANPTDLYNALSALARNLYNQKKLAAAEATQLEALELARKLHGPEHRDVATALNGVGTILREEGKLAEAEPFLREALGTYRKLSGGKPSPDIQVVLGNHALLLKSQGKLAEAEAEFRESLEIAKTTLGPDHPFAGRALVYLASTEAGQERLGEAETHAREALVIARKAADDFFLCIVLNQLGEILRRERKLDGAQQLYSEALEIYRKNGSGESARAADTMNGLARVLQYRQEWAEAEALLRRAVAIREKQTPDDWHIFSARGLLGANLVAQKKYADAEPLLTSACAGLEQRFGHSLLQEARVPFREGVQGLALLYEATGRSNQAAQWRSKLAQLEPAGGK